MGPTRANFLRGTALVTVLAALLASAGCGAPKITFIYPDEALDAGFRITKTPSLYIDTVTDMRPPEQRQGRGKFVKITYPKDAAWEVPATQVYGEALAKDLAQTQMVELVALHAQAEYILSADLLSMACELRRSAGSFLLPAAVGAGAGMAFGEDGSNRLKLGAVLAALSVMAIPVPTMNYAEAEVRLTLKDRAGNIVWEKACLGQFEERRYITATAREDQKLVNQHLTKAVKRANACLLGQLRQFLMEEMAAGGQ